MVYPLIENNERGKNVRLYALHCKLCFLHKAHIDKDIVHKIRQAMNANNVLGGKQFQEQIEVVFGRRITKGKKGRPKKRVGLN